MIRSSGAWELIKVLRIIARLNLGGPARCVIHLARGLEEHGFETLVAAGTPEAWEGDMSGDLLARGGRLAPIPGLAGRIHPFKDLRALSALRKLVRDFRPRIIHTHTAKAGLLGRLSASCIEPKPLCVHTFHGHVLDGYFGALPSAFFRIMEQTLARRTEALIAVSPSVRDELVHGHGVGRADQYRVIPSGYPLLPPAGAGTLRAELGFEDAVLAGVVGRMVPIKGHALLLEALPSLLEKVPNLKVVMAGDGPLRSSLEARARGRGLGEAVRFLGNRRDRGSLFQSLDLLILPSLKEGLPTVLLEAGAAGVAVIASRIPGVTDLFTHEEDALLFEPGSAEGLAREAARLALDPAMRSRLAARAREVLPGKVPDYRAVAAAHASLYGELLERSDG